MGDELSEVVRATAADDGERFARSLELFSARMAGFAEGIARARRPEDADRLPYDQAWAAAHAEVPLRDLLERVCGTAGADVPTRPPGSRDSAMWMGNRRVRDDGREWWPVYRSRLEGGHDHVGEIVHWDPDRRAGGYRANLGGVGLSGWFDDRRDALRAMCGDTPGVDRVLWLGPSALRADGRRWWRVYRGWTEDDQVGSIVRWDDGALGYRATVHGRWATLREAFEAVQRVVEARTANGTEAM